MALLCNNISHWLAASLESALNIPQSIYIVNHIYWHWHLGLCHRISVIIELISNDLRTSIAVNHTCVSCPYFFYTGSYSLKDFNWFCTYQELKIQFTFMLFMSFNHCSNFYAHQFYISEGYFCHCVVFFDVDYAYSILQAPSIFSANACMLEWHATYNYLYI